MLTLFDPLAQLLTVYSTKYSVSSVCTVSWKMFDAWSDMMQWCCSNQCKKYLTCTHTLKFGSYVPWICTLLGSPYVVIGPAKTFIRMLLNFPGIYVTAFNSNPDLHFQLGHKLVCHSSFKSSQLEMRGTNWFSDIISYLLYFIYVCLMFCTFKVMPTECSPAPKTNCLGPSGHLLGHTTW